MLEKMMVEVNEGWGFSLACYWADANFSILDFGWHWHPRPHDGIVMRPNDFCPFRLGVYVTLFGLGISVGKFAKFKKA